MPAPQTTIDPAALDRAAIRDLPPSAKLVLHVLCREGECTQQELAARTWLPHRTIRYALGRLDDAGLITARHSYQDARQRYYRVADDIRESATGVEK